MAKRKTQGVFNTNKRIRLGVWGLGRGLNFYSACASLNLDVVAGCDFNAHMRDRFQELNPDAFVTDDAEAFLAQDFDAVLLATFCPAHADDAIQCLKAGKHVLSEVTAFHTMAEGVRLTEAVEKSGLVYNLAENYPFTAPHFYLARRWHEGLFGDLMYAEGEYVHEVRTLAYTYIDGVPIEPGDLLHTWRSWINFHYYCTHSLGPIMHITGTRPARVVSLPGGSRLVGYPDFRSDGLGSVAPSLITMDNGALVKNLMGGTTNDTHLFRYWGDKGAAVVDHGLSLRLGGGGSCPMHAVKADWGEFTPFVEGMGHGGGDFFVLYYFARQILFGDPAPFDVYVAADVTIPGILAYRSSHENGQAYDVPDFRKKKDRDAWREDHTAQPRPDVANALFPKRADKTLTHQFNRTISRLTFLMHDVRAFEDWYAVVDDMEDPAQVIGLADKLIKNYPEIQQFSATARQLVEAYPKSRGASLLSELLDMMDADTVLKEDYLASVRKKRSLLKRKLK